MADGTKIEWADATWNAVTGCKVVSPGCTNCYAMRLAGTRLRHHPTRRDLTIDSKAGPVWNGDVRLNEGMLKDPLRWRRPRRVFVCAHGDLFYEAVPDEWIDRVFGVMALAPQHTFLVLTKRAQRMRDYCRDEQTPFRIARTMEWPLSNCWLGVSVEDQQRADERIPLLLDTPAAKRFISAEPLLGPLVLDGRHLIGDETYWNFMKGEIGSTVQHVAVKPEATARVDWMIVGGESGPGARPMDPVWVRSLRDQCDSAGTAFFFKQWGEWHPDALRYTSLAGECPPANMKIGKKASGRLLDGKEWSEFPDG